METANTHRPVKRTLAVVDGGLTVATHPRAPAANQKPKLLDQVRQAIRTRHYSYRTEKAYVYWIKRFIFFHNKRHPLEMASLKSTNFFQVSRRIGMSVVRRKIKL